MTGARHEWPLAATRSDHRFLAQASGTRRRADHSVKPRFRILFYPRWSMETIPNGIWLMALASLGTRSPRTVGPGRQPASRVLRCAAVLRMTAATDRAGIPCGPAGRLAHNLLAEMRRLRAAPLSRTTVGDSRTGRGALSWLRAVTMGRSDTGSCRQRSLGSRSGDADTLRIETGSVAEHRAGNVEQAVGHRTQGAGVSVTAAA